MKLINSIIPGKKFAVGSAPLSVTRATELTGTRVTKRKKTFSPLVHFVLFEMPDTQSTKTCFKLRVDFAPVSIVGYVFGVSDVAFFVYCPLIQSTV